jgi:hypothetical protein
MASTVREDLRLSVLAICLALLAILLAELPGKQNPPELRIAANVPSPEEAKKEKEKTQKAQEPMRIQVRIVKQQSEETAKKASAQKAKANKKSAPLIKPNPGRAVTRGRALLADGQTPTFEGHLGLTFYQYMRRVHLVGGLLVVYDRTENRIVGRIRGGKFYRDVDMHGLAVRAKDVTEDIPRKTIRAYLDMVRDAVGTSGYRFLIVLPKAREAQFVGTLDAILRQAGLRMEDVDLVRYRYLLEGSQLVVRLESVSVNGQAKSVMRSAVLWADR